jgi:hypothetical protein
MKYAPKPASIKELREQLRAQLLCNKDPNQEKEVSEKLHKVSGRLPVIRDHKPAGRANFAEAEELRHIVAAIYQGDTEADRAEALDAALDDPVDALICYRAIAAERGIYLPDQQQAQNGKGN